MKTTTRILINVIQRRMENGENLENILADYPKLQGEELTEVQNEIMK